MWRRGKSDEATRCGGQAPRRSGEGAGRTGQRPVPRERNLQSARSSPAAAGNLQSNSVLSPQSSVLWHRRRRRPGWIKPVVLLVVAGGALFWWLSPSAPRKHAVKCVVVGLDGLDPNLVKKFMDKGLLPNFKRLADQGGFSPLATSNPPQSPVAWSCFVTGMNPGGTGVFDFVHRDPEQYEPVEAMTSPETAKPLPIINRTDVPIPFTSYRMPLRNDKVNLTRQGTPFWSYLEEEEVPAVVLRVPCNYPPTAGQTRQLTGMGTPDLTGSTGAYFYWTDQELTDDERENLRGRANLEVVEIVDSRIETQLVGPPNMFLRDEKARQKEMAIKFSIAIDDEHGTARIHLNGNDAVLKPGDWSAWMPVTFGDEETWLSILGGKPGGIIKFRLKSLDPFELYATPINIDPANPAMQITNPRDYAKELAENVGAFTTLGMPEDDKAMGSKVRALDEEGFRQQCRDVLNDVWKTTRYELERYQGGFFFTYFRTTDVVGHMMWFAMDPDHPARGREGNEEAAKKHELALEESYRWVDEKVGEIRKTVGDDCLFMVMSDHGFAPFYRQVELNSWLLDNGWVTLYPWADREQAVISGAATSDIDWANTKAYCLGLNSLYINVKGREAQGMIPPEERAAVVKELCAALENIVDPETGEKMISRAYPREEVYSGKHVERAPDILVGYNRGYRTSWRSALGQFPPPGELKPTQAEGPRQRRRQAKRQEPVRLYAKDNTGRWSGDHCCDPVHVPGTLIVNRPISKKDPALTDLAPTILQEFGIAKPAEMIGSPVVEKKK